MEISIDTRALLLAFAVVSTIAFALALLLIAWVLYKIRRINLPPQADVFDALRAAPLSVVIILDLLDLGLDIFSAPITWVLLNRLGLSPLRGVAVAKDLIPFADVVPAMTLGWVGIRLYDRRPSQHRTVYRIER